jgi:hypothetical protein
LFVDETLPLPRWLKIDNLEDLKGYLITIVIAVLAVLFLRQAVERAGDLDLLRFAAALALMIVTRFSFYPCEDTQKNESCCASQQISLLDVRFGSKADITFVDAIAMSALCQKQT